MKFSKIALMLTLSAGIAAAQTFTCDIGGYKPVDGVTAVIKNSTLILTWQGEPGQQLMAQFSIRDGQPLVQELAARSNSGRWINLGKNLTPDFQVTTGKRRTSGGLVNLLKSLNVDTPEEEIA